MATKAKKGSAGKSGSTCCRQSEEAKPCPLNANERSCVGYFRRMTDDAQVKLLQLLGDYLGEPAAV